jgi:hypothetical protein
MSYLIFVNVEDHILFINNNNNMEVFGWLGFAFSVLYVIEKVLLKTKRCKSSCCGVVVENEAVSMSPKHSAPPEVVI